MTKWLRFHMDHGRTGNGTQLLAEDTWKDTHQAQMHLREGSTPVTKPYFPESDLRAGYGLAWNIGNYRGGQALSIHWSKKYIPIATHGCDATGCKY